jgi:S-adenosylmethionine:tRNA ribosyltransferase-isomerase
MAAAERASAPAARGARAAPADAALDFALPPELEADAPAEARGLARDGVRLMVSAYADDRVVHARFRDLPRFLREGDVLVINTSATLPAALPARRPDGRELRLHLSGRLPADDWVAELREPAGVASRPFRDGVVGEVLALPDGGRVTLLAPYARVGAGVRLWVARLEIGAPVVPYLARHGEPIRYGYAREAWPLAAYQTVYAAEPGSAEMPSAGRAFTPELITWLVAHGVQVAPVLLHAGVASLEDHEPPQEEYFRVSAPTARLVNAARAAGGRVVAVGTTVVRALESAADEDGAVHPGDGWTRLVVTPARGVRAVDALLTGFHEPKASHLAMLEALAGRRHLRVAYAAALGHRYLWHEFGDLHLIVPTVDETLHVTRNA